MEPDASKLGDPNADEKFVEEYLRKQRENWTCDVCRKEPAIAALCVPGVAMSMAYGEGCISKDAHPFGILRANVICCGGVENTHPSYLEMNVYHDGRYMTLAEALKLMPITEQELRFDDLSEPPCSTSSNS